MRIIWLRNTENIAFDTAKEKVTYLGRKNTSQFYSMSENTLKGKKDLPDLDKNLSEYDFTMMLQGKKKLSLDKTRES